MGGNCSALPDGPVADGVSVSKKVPRGVTVALPCGTGALPAEPPPQPWRQNHRKKKLYCRQRACHAPASTLRIKVETSTVPLTIKPKK
jgi:hypothetical protein